MKVWWEPAEIERWLQRNSYKDISVDSYDVTIYPAESFQNKLTKEGQLRSQLSPDWSYQAEFTDLQGGTTEYVVTIATVIGKSRMRGERIVTYLAPSGPEEHPDGFCYNVKTHSAQLRWEMPKGEFMKYVLTLSQEEEKVQEKEFSKKLCRYTLTGLKPGKLYKVELSTMTGAILTRDSIVDYLLTKPLPVDKLRASVEATGAFLEWSTEGVVDGETVVEVKTHDDNETDDEKVEEIFLPPTVTSYTLASLAPLTTVTVSVSVRSVLGFYISTSDLRHTTFTTPPHPPTNLRERSREASQLVVEWDPPVETIPGGKYRVVVISTEGGYRASTEEEGTVFVFTLPDSGVGHRYKVQVVYAVHGVESSPVEAVF